MGLVIIDNKMHEIKGKTAMASWYKIRDYIEFDLFLFLYDNIRAKIDSDIFYGIGGTIK
jgi:hypothetical protein